MIYLYSGTPGSGKSLHMAKVIYTVLKKTECLVICNFMINESCFTEEELKRFIFLDNNDMIPENLVRIAEEYWAHHKAKSYRDAETRIRLFIDEAQILFNARDWQKNYSLGWTFFSVHRHYGFEVVLCTQIDTNLDKQVRALIETQCIHRKIENIGAWWQVCIYVFWWWSVLLCRSLVSYARKRLTVISSLSKEVCEDIRHTYVIQ